MMEIAVISGKGGTGKSSISAAFATLGENLVLADCDVDAANLFLLFNPSHDEEEIFISGQKAEIDESLCSNCGICIDYCRFDAISYINGKVKISETSCDGCKLCAWICPLQAITMMNSDKSRMYSGVFRNGMMVYGRLAPGEENSGKLVSLVREKARKLAVSNNLSTIILDGPPGIGCPVISAITGVDKIMIVTEPTLSGLHDLRRTVELVKQSGGNAGIIINKFDLNPAMSVRIEEWCREQGYDVVGKLPFEELVVEAMVQGKSITEWAPDHVISREIKNIWSSILNIN